MADSLEVTADWASVLNFTTKIIAYHPAYYVGIMVSLLGIVSKLFENVFQQAYYDAGAKV